MVASIDFGISRTKGCQTDENVIRAWLWMASYGGGYLFVTSPARQNSSLTSNKKQSNNVGNMEIKWIWFILASFQTVNLFNGFTPEIINRH